MPSGWQSSFPTFKVEPDVLYVDEGNVMTSAGSAAGIDLLLHLVRKDYGPRVANLFARRMVVPPHRDGGQSQFVVQPIAVRTNDRISSVAAWMARHLDEAITIETLADRAAMSERTFTRRFRAATGAAPIEWLLRLRVRRAQDLLETTDQSDRPHRRGGRLRRAGNACGIISARWSAPAPRSGASLFAAARRRRTSK